MKKRLPLITLCTLALAACSPEKSALASAEAAQNPAAQRYAKQAVQLFVNVCLVNAADEERIAATATQNHLLELDDNQKRQFNFEPEAKRAWGAHSKDGGQFFIAAGKNYCSVKAKTADNQTIETEAENIVRKAEQSMNLQSEKVKDSNIGESKTAHQTAYRLSKPNQPSGLLLTVQTDSNPDAGAQAALNIHLVPVEQLK